MPGRTVRINGKMVRESRYLMEQQLGRKLLGTEHVHHINKDPMDNRLENLAVMDRTEHLRMHKQIHSDIKACEECGSHFLVNPRNRLNRKTCSSPCARAMNRRTMAATKRINRPLKTPASFTSEDTRGERHHKAILTAPVVLEMRRRHAAGESATALSREFGVSPAAGHHAISGRTWRHL